MPPKKTKAKAVKKGKSPAEVDGLSTKEISNDQLMDQIVLLREELERERKERNYFQLERDKIHTFWEITKTKLEEKQADLRNKDRELEEAEERHQLEIKVYKQKVRHLMSEQQNNITELKTEGVVSTGLLQKEHANLESDLRKRIQNREEDLRKQVLSYENLIKSLKLKHSEEITQLREDFAREVKVIQTKYELKARDLHEEQELRYKTDTEELEEKKNRHINALMQNQEKAISDIETFYKDITAKNLALINELKQNEEAMTKKVNELEREIVDLARKHKQRIEPLQKAAMEVHNLRKKLTNYKRDKRLLAAVRAQLKEVDKVKFEYEILQQQFSKVEQERDDLYKNFTKAIQEVQQRSSLKEILLTKKITALTEALEKK